MSKSQKDRALAKNSKTIASNNLHVIHRDNTWIVRSEASYQPFSVHRTQGEAVEAARNLAKSNAGELIIHGRDGRIRERGSFSNDPNPPKEPRKVMFPKDARVSRTALKKAVAVAKDIVLAGKKETGSAARNNSEG
jgi:Uncharacterized protein conserved in bacteria (DUF2188)